MISKLSEGGNLLSNKIKQADVSILVAVGFQVDLIAVLFKCLQQGEQILLGGFPACNNDVFARIFLHLRHYLGGGHFRKRGLGVFGVAPRATHTATA